MDWLLKWFRREPEPFLTGEMATRVMSAAMRVEQKAVAVQNTVADFATTPSEENAAACLAAFDELGDAFIPFAYADIALANMLEEQGQGGRS